MYSNCFSQILVLIFYAFKCKLRNNKQISCNLLLKIRANFPISKLLFAVKRIVANTGQFLEFQLLFMFVFFLLKTKMKFLAM